MIIKIWDIKADYAKEPGKVGGFEGLKNAAEYIMDPDKTIVDESEFKKIQLSGVLSENSYSDFFNDDTNRVIKYMANVDKTEGRYVTGYMCQPERVIKDFEEANNLLRAMAGKEKKKETGAVAFHIVQSFPKNLNISAEEVHECGVELVKKLGAHQAVICSHVHPVYDEETGEVHGEAMHNHILINAYIHPEHWDPEHPDRLKYNDCKASYAQLRVWNDEIAIAHGLPIIRNPDEERTYSWTESDAMNKGLSWRERIRMDIESAKRISSSWDEFTEVMQAAGYQIKDGVHTTYTAPDDKHKARADKLGRDYTKANLELYWAVKGLTDKVVSEAKKEEDSPLLSGLLLSLGDVITAAIPVGIKGAESSRSFYYYPLSGKTDINLSAAKTYFEPDEYYDICDENKNPVAAVKGSEILEFIENQISSEKNNEKVKGSQDKAYEEETKNKNRYYSNFYSTKTSKRYNVSLYDQFGRRLSKLELLFIIAIIVLKAEDGLWNKKGPTKNDDGNIIFAPTNKKIQNMIDSIYIARDEKIENPAELSERVNNAGAALSRARVAYENTARAKSKMDELHEAVSDYMKVKDISEKINAMPDSQEKKNLQKKYAAHIERYKKAKAIMYRYDLTEEEKIKDFKQRYEKVQIDVNETKERFDAAKEEYRKLKKLQYSAELAQNAQYCYGPEYSEYREEEKDIAREKQFDEVNDKNNNQYNLK